MTTPIPPVIAIGLTDRSTTLARFTVDHRALQVWVTESEDDEGESDLALPNGGSEYPATDLADLVTDAVALGVIIGHPGLRLQVCAIDHPRHSSYLVALRNYPGPQTGLALVTDPTDVATFNESDAPIDVVRGHLEAVIATANALLDQLDPSQS